jgi:hypothetical protein
MSLHDILSGDFFTEYIKKGGNPLSFRRDMHGTDTQ